MSYVENAGKYELYHWSLFEELQVIESIGRGRRFYLNRISNKEMNRTSSEDSYKDLCWYITSRIVRLWRLLEKDAFPVIMEIYALVYESDEPWVFMSEQVYDSYELWLVYRNFIDIDF